MAKTLLAGCAYVIFSELTPEEIDRFKLYEPDALKMYDDANPEDTFSIDIGEGPGRLEETRAVFSRTKSAEGKATITIILDPDVEDKLELVRQKLTGSLIKLQALEELALKLRESANENEGKVNSMITIL